MYFPLQYVDHPPVARMADVATRLFERIEDVDDFNLSLVPRWLWREYRSDANLRARYEAVFMAYKALDARGRTLVRRAAQNNNAVEDLCSKKSVHLQNLRIQQKAIHTGLTLLFKHLWSKVLGKDPEFRTHYEKFITGNDMIVVCPFCGCERYEDLQGGVRNPYDHYLCKCRYPLATLNFRNLVPMCERCNRNPGKGSKDVIHTDRAQTQRRYAFYPYGQIPHVSVTLTQRSPGTLRHDPEWTVQLRVAGNSATTREKINTWITVFDLPRRYGARINGGARTWIGEFRAAHPAITAATDLNELRRSLTTWAAGYSPINRRRIEPEAVLKQAYYNYLAVSASNAELMGIIGKPPWT